MVQKPNNEREYYQIAFTVNDEKTFEREISAFRNIRDNYPKFLLTLDFDNTSFEGIHKVNVIDWHGFYFSFYSHHSSYTGPKQSK